MESLALFLCIWLVLVVFVLAIFSKEEDSDDVPPDKWDVV